MALSERTTYKKTQTSLPNEYNGVTVRETRNILPYRGLYEKPSENLTNFERFMKLKLNNENVQEVTDPVCTLPEKRQPSRGGKFPLILETKEPDTKTILLESIGHKLETPTPHGLAQYLRLSSAKKPTSRSRSQGKLGTRPKKATIQILHPQEPAKLKLRQASTEDNTTKEGRKESTALESIASLGMRDSARSSRAFKNTVKQDSKDFSLRGVSTQIFNSGSNAGSLAFVKDMGHNESLTMRNDISDYGITDYDILRSGPQSMREITTRATTEREKVKETNRSRFADEGSRSASKLQVIDVMSLADLQTTRADFETASQHRKVEKEGKVSEFSYNHTQRALSSSKSKRKLSEVSSQSRLSNRNKRQSAVASLGMISSMRVSPVAGLNNSTKNNSQDASIQLDSKRDYIPDWLDKRPDFKDTCKVYAIEAKDFVPRACSKPSYNRTPEELEATMSWLQKIHMFRVLPSSVLQSIAEKLKLRVYVKDELLCSQGDEADCLYVIFSGMVQCLVNGAQVAVYKGGDAVGQTALDSAVPRTATLKAMSNSSVLRLEKADYAFTMEYYAMKQREEILNTVKRVKVFEDMDETKQSRVVAFLQSKYYSKGEVIYREGENAESLFIVKQGIVSVDSSISIEKENMWPAGMSLWEKYIQVRDTKFSQIIKPNTYFGHPELLNNTKRVSTAVCIEDAHVLILNKKDFFSLLDADDIAKAKYLLSNSSVGDMEKIRKKVVEREQQRNKMKKIMVKAITEDLGPLNPVELKRRTEKVVEPAMERIKHDFRNYIKQNTVKLVKKYEKVPHNLDEFDYKC